MTPMSFPRGQTLMDLTDGFAGKLMAAMPHLVDTPFEKALALICSHDENHAFGVVINKPMPDVTVADVLAELDLMVDHRAELMPVYFGGPVGLERGAVVHDDDYRENGTISIAPGINLTATMDALQALASGQLNPERAMLVMGHAGWSSGQLENEVKRNDWLSLQARPEMIFSADTDRWDDALVQLGISDLTMFDANESLVARPN